MKTDLIFSGPPGSGKSTQAQIIAKEIDAQIIATGEIARELAKTDPKTRELLQKGQLAPEPLIRQELKKRLLSLPPKTRIIFDGIPRTLSQASWLDELLKEKGRNLPIMVYIHLEPEEIFDRLLKRKICPRGGEVYYPKQKAYRENFCEIHKLRLVRRTDDTEESLKKRLEIFFGVINQIKQFYKKRGRLLEINGDQTVAGVTKEILLRLSKLNLLR